MGAKSQLFADLALLARYDPEALGHILNEMNGSIRGTLFVDLDNIVSHLLSLPKPVPHVMIMITPQGISVDLVEERSGQRWRIVE